VPIPPRLQRKLEQTFGPEAAEDFMSWMETVDTTRADIAELRHEMQIGFTRMETVIERRTADLMKWSFVFWVGAVLAIAALAKVLE
jgi:hypothetical protein